MYNSDSKGGSIFKYSSTACNDILIKVDNKVSFM